MSKRPYLLPTPEQIESISRQISYEDKVLTHMKLLAHYIHASHEFPGALIAAPCKELSVIFYTGGGIIDPNHPRNYAEVLLAGEEYMFTSANELHVWLIMYLPTIIRHYGCFNTRDGLVLAVNRNDTLMYLQSIEYSGNLPTLHCYLSFSPDKHTALVTYESKTGTNNLVTKLMRQLTTEEHQWVSTIGTKFTVSVVGKK